MGVSKEVYDLLMSENCGKTDPHPENPGAWVVYGIDCDMPYPLFLSSTESDAHQYVVDVRELRINVGIKFWEFGDEWGTK